MVLRNVAVFLISLAFAAASAMAGVPNLSMSTASTAAGEGVIPVLYNLPNGHGSAFGDARSTGGVVNATITVTLLTGAGAPVTNFPAADLWLVKEVVAGTGNFIACIDGTTADQNTNASGVTTWSAPLRAGGWSMSKTVVVVGGSPLESNAGLVLRHNSADINGDGTANLSDIPAFAADFGTTAFRSDLMYDGSVNVSDVPRLAAGMAAACP